MKWLAKENTFRHCLNPLLAMIIISIYIFHNKSDSKQCLAVHMIYFCYATDITEDSHMSVHEFKHSFKYNFKKF